MVCVLVVVDFFILPCSSPSTIPKESGRDISHVEKEWKSYQLVPTGELGGLKKPTGYYLTRCHN